MSLGLSLKTSNETALPPLAEWLVSGTKKANALQTTLQGGREVSVVNAVRPTQLAFNVTDIPKEAGQLVESLKGGANNIVPFLRKVTELQVPDSVKKEIIKDGIKLMGGTAKFLEAVKPFAKMLAPWAERANIVLLPLAVADEFNAWFNTPVADGTLPPSLRNKTPSTNTPQVTTPSVLPSQTPAQTPSNNIVGPAIVGGRQPQ
jgi:hypothetical protein